MVVTANVSAFVIQQTLTLQSVADGFVWWVQHDEAAAHAIVGGTSQARNSAC